MGSFKIFTSAKVIKAVVATFAVISFFVLYFNTLNFENLDQTSIQLLDQTDQNLWSHIRKNHIFLPSTLPYNFPSNFETAVKPDDGLVTIIKRLFKEKKGGFFVEVGAHDGIDSHTLALERYSYWSGLLIECHPVLVPKLKALHRKAYVSDVCLSSSSYPEIATMTSVDSWMHSSSLGTGNIFPQINSNLTKIQVLTMPLYPILAAINVTEIDVIVLDIQSTEVFVLRSFPFHLVHVKAWVIEVVLVARPIRDEIVTIMRNNGYSKTQDLGNDILFIHDSFET